MIQLPYFKDKVLLTFTIFTDKADGLKKIGLLIFGKGLEEKRFALKNCDSQLPFGLTFNSYTSGTENLYKYNGKEEQKELGIYDYGARYFDPSIARFTTIDPLTSSYYSWSPYHYAANNPIKLVDINGMGWGDFLDDLKAGFKTYADFTGITTAVNKVKEVLQSADELTTGNEPDTRQQEYNNRGGIEFYKTEGDHGSPSTVGEPEASVDITVLTNAKGVGPAPSFGPPANSGEKAMEIVTSLNQILDIAMTPSDNDEGEVTKTDTLRGTFTDENHAIANYRIVVDGEGDTLDQKYYVPDGY